MSILSILYRTFVEALFPFSKVEEELLAMTPEEAYKVLPQAAASPIYNAFSVFAYADERVSKLVWQIKYMKSDKAIMIGGYALARRLRELCQDQNLILVPIPITKLRRRERGFNQCELLLEAIKKFDNSNTFTICNDLLIRTRHKDRQTLKSREERLKGAQGIFTANPKAAEGISKDSTIVVIDDVITTGSTIKEAATTLKIKFGKVFGMSLAH